MLRSIYSKIKSNEKATVNGKYFFCSGLIFHHRESGNKKTTDNSSKLGQHTSRPLPPPPYPYFSCVSITWQTLSKRVQGYTFSWFIMNKKIEKNKFE